MPHFDATKSRSQFRGHEYSIKNLPFITAMAIIHSLRRERRHGWVASLLYKPEHMDNGRPQCTQGVLNLYIDEMKGYTLNLLKSIHGVCPSKLFTQNKIQYFTG